VYFTRRQQKDGSKYFGPFVNTGSLRRTLRLIKNIFPFRSCNRVITGTSTRPCLNYHINRCLGPCIGAVSKKDYDKVINQVILFLDGKQELIVRELKNKMTKASEQLQFEKAALFRDQIKAIESVIEAQQIAVAVHGEMDVIAIAQTNDLAYVEVFFIRNNKLIGRDSIPVDGIQDESPEQIITNFVKQYYASSSSIPPKILLQYAVNEPRTIIDWLKKLKGSSVKLLVPSKGTKKQLVEIVAENAKEGLSLYLTEHPSVIEYDNVLSELKERLLLTTVPLRIEGYDISNIHGNLSVGSMVVFDKGIPKPAHYRRFKIKTVPYINDYSMIQEVLKRRFHNYLNREDKWAIIPDLVLIDGGKGHLHAAIEAMHGLGVDSIPVASIAKEKEEVFIPGKTTPVDIPKNSASLHLLQRVRDESHRFALSYHQKLRSKKSMLSVLDSIPGIGPKRKKALLKRFGSVQNIKNAAKEELTTVIGITDTVAETIKEYL
jgi:excinuclease ABC subunit C